MMENTDPLRILFVEDLPSDTLLAEREIRKSDLTFISQRVDTKDAFMKALEEFHPDVIVSDHSMPEFDGLQALKLSLKHDSRIPFILLTGSVNEETAAACMKAGASDYVIKEHMSRLPFAVKEALEQKKMRAAKDEAERALRESEERLRTFVDSATDLVFLKDNESRYLLVNSANQKFFRRPEAEIIGMTDFDLMPHEMARGCHQSDREAIEHNEMVVTLEQVNDRIFESRKFPVKQKDGKVGVGGFVRDITDRRRAEKEIALLAHTVRSISESVSITDLNDTILFVNEAFLKMYGYDKREILGENIKIVRSPNSSQEIIEGITTATLRGGWHGELLNQTRDGREFPVSVSTSCVRDDSGQPIALVGVATDITDRKKTEAKIAEALEWQEAMFEGSRDAIFVSDVDSRLVSVNGAASQLTGYAKEELLSMRIPDLHEAEDLGAYFEFHDRIIAGEEIVSEAKLRQKGGKKIDTEFSNKRVVIDGVLYMHSTAKDITERKKVEVALAESEKKFKWLFDYAPVAYHVLTPEGTITDVNIRWCKTFGYSKDEVLGKPIYDFVSKDERSIAKASFEAKKKNVTSMRTKNERRYVAKDGSVKTFLVGDFMTLDPEGKITSIQTTMEDITERKKAEHDLCASEERFRSVWNNSADGMRLIDREGRIIAANAAYGELVNMPLEKLAGEIFSVVYRKGGPDGDIRIYHKRFDSKEILSKLRTAVTLWNGKVLELDISNSFIESGGDERMVLSIFHDITEKKRAQVALRASEERFRALFEESKDVVYFSTVDGRLLDINPAGVKLLGYGSKEDALQIDLTRDGYADAKDKKRFDRQMGKDGYVRDFEAILKRKDGGQLTALETATAVRDRDGKIVQYRGIIRDVTRQRQLEAQFLQAQKMESIGTLAGGIAHDFNNILGIILGHVALLDRSRENEEQFSESVLSINRAVERGASLVRQILTFARRAETQLEPVSINSTIKELAKMLEETLPKTIGIVQKLDKTIPVISMDPTQLHQTLLNLCVNARDAMNGQGTLTLATHLVPSSDLSPRFPKATNHHYVQVSVKDTGTGMNEETRQRIFEPFFTTKEKGKGTGLGLAVVYGVLQAHNGFVDVESVPEAGTTFHLFLPVPEGILTISEDRKETQEDLPRGTETILVVEDEDVLRDLLAKLLEMQGYKVIPACDGEEAVTRFREHADEIDLVLSDMGLPKRSGWDAFRMMRELDSSVQTLLASGYIEPGQKSEILKSGVARFIHKPYKMEEVLAAIRETLDQKKSDV